MEKDDEAFQIDLTTCEKEPIHIPNKIQRFGFLLAMDKATLQIVQCTDNVVDFIGFPHAKLLGLSLASLIEKSIIEKIEYAIRHNGVNFATLNPVKLGFNHLSTKFKAVLHISQGVLVMEVEPALYDEFSYSDFYNNATIIIGKFHAQKDIYSLCQVVTEQVKRITGYDRVMVYRFDKNWNGEVIAESRNGKLYSFLGQHFPASDIPAQARQLYLTNTIRIITDASYKPSEIIPAINPLTNTYLDLSQSFLRSISPIHIEYVQNMGVAATLTASIIVEGQLWGMISCHHYAPKFLDYRLRTVVEHISKLFSYHLHLLEDIDDIAFMVETKDKEKELIKHFLKDDDLFNTLSKHPNLLLGLNSASGMVILYENNFYKTGVVPERSFINLLFNWLYAHHPEEIFFTNTLSDLLPESLPYKSTASGILVMRLAQNTKNFIIWFKPEVIQTVSWGGNPHKKVIVVPEEDGYRLSPRKSFEKWEKEVYRQAIPWTKSEIKVAEGVYRSILELLASHTERLQQQKMMLEVQIRERTMEIQAIYEELQVTNEEIRASNDHLRNSLDKIEKLNHELQNAQRKIKSIFDSTKDVHFLVDRTCKVLFFNKAAVQNGQEYHQEQLKEGDSLLSYIGDDEQAQAKLKQQVQRAFDGEIFEVEEKVVYSPSLSVWFKTEFYPVEENKEIIGVAINITNIDKLKKSQERINTHNELLKKIAFIQSHEVRRPVATILGLINLFDKEDLTADFNGVIIEKLELATKELDEVIHRIVKATYQIEDI
ncbi:MAG: GAF domain-containing protein [Cytophagales bacterium]|nr:MAG: GAF domain-containing protein [Cytophagales bacterium]